MPCWTLALAAALWLGAAGGGFGVLYAYGFKPGEAAAATPRWPENCALQRTSGQPTLIIFAHPHCPCTRATLENLSHAMLLVDQPLTTFVVFVRPAGVPTDWERTDLWSTASAIPGAQVLLDDGGALAGQFHAVTSGQALLFGRDGELMFRGGITESRGHAGNSLGVESILASLHGRVPPCDHTAVFGCQLIADSSDAAACEAPCTK